MIGNSIFYFNPCCGGLEPFGIPNNSIPFVDFPGFTDTVGTQYSLVIVGSYSGCVEYSGSSSTYLSGINIKNYSVNLPTFEENDCVDCIENIFPCYTQPSVTPPIIIGYKNECGIITILPMIVECEVSDPSSYESSDGEISVSITGGTPPYTTTWLNDGTISPALNNIGIGSYTATTVDYWLDYTATTVCDVIVEKNCSFGGTIEIYIPSPPECYCYIYTFTVLEDGFVCFFDCGAEMGNCLYYAAGPTSHESLCVNANSLGGAITITSETVCDNWCDPLATIPPIVIDNTKSYYTIQITEGTSPGPYTIYYSQVPSIIPPMLPSNELAQNISLDDLELGIIIEVPNDTGVIYLYNEFCPNNTLTLIVPTITSYSDFCLSVSSQKKGGYSTTNIHFIYNGLDSNNKPTWSDESNSSSIISWDGTKWLLSPTLIYGNIMSSTSQLTPSTTYPSNWVGVGGSILSSIIVEEGTCLPIRKQLPPVSVTQPTCVCDGSIIFNVTLDNPPLNYSIDNGVTYYSSSMFTDLCNGIYNLSVVDSMGDVFSSSVTLNKLEQSITYNISLNTTNTTPVNNNTSLVNSYETTVVVTPPLPDGTTITFDIIHSNNFYSSPNSGTSILTTSTNLFKNINGITLSNTSNNTNQFINTAAGCQTDYVYQSNIDDVWSSLTITNNDVITINTTSRVDKTSLGECVVGYSLDSYSISNPVISGCDCCSIKIN
jgi:hypothetical protein